MIDTFAFGCLVGFLVSTIIGSIFWWKEAR